MSPPRAKARPLSSRGQRRCRRPVPGGPISPTCSGPTTRRRTDERIPTHMTRRTRSPAMSALDDTSTTVTALDLPNASAPVYSTVCDTALGPVLLTSDGEHLTGLYLEVSDETTHRLHRSFGVEPSPDNAQAVLADAEAKLRGDCPAEPR